MNKKYFKEFLLREYGIMEVEFRRSGDFKVCYIQNKPYHYTTISKLFLAVVYELELIKHKTKTYKLKEDKK